MPRPIPLALRPPQRPKKVYTDPRAVRWLSPWMVRPQAGSKVEVVTADGFKTLALWNGYEWQNEAGKAIRVDQWRVLP